ncbi:MAG: SAM-dependent methyltransferase [Alphaproteobacteria bacterium]|nr:SAM-dependent methyltransferase [Alphaproteobacteria bacterium]
MTPLAALLKDRIAREGPITVAQYMEAALSHPEHGYYMTRDPFGAAGDFVTAPEVSQLFGEMLGAWLAVRWHAMGAPSGVALLELGPGRGTLMADILRATKRVAGFHDALRVFMLEISPVLKAAQRRALREAHPRIQWIGTLEALPHAPVLAVANEFFDALPVRQFVRQNAGWQERRVGIGKNGFVVLPPPQPADEVKESHDAAAAVMRGLARRIVRAGGAALIVDYGECGGHTLQAVKRHAHADALAAPGEADITAQVDFQALAEAARGEGAAVFGPVTQGAFLRRLGIELRAAALCRNVDMAAKHRILSGLERLVSPAQMGELFQVMAVTSMEPRMPEGF